MNERGEEKEQNPIWKDARKNHVVRIIRRLVRKIFGGLTHLKVKFKMKNVAHSPKVKEKEESSSRSIAVAEEKKRSA